MAEPIDLWVQRLRTIARPALVGTPLIVPEQFSVERRAAWIDEFEDEYGTRTAIDGFLVALAMNMPWGSADHAPDDVCTMLWRRLAAGRCGGVDELAGMPPPIAANPDEWALEHETHKELAAVHALWFHARRNEKLLGVLDAAESWLIANVQPDNATCHPWAVHAFAARAQRLSGTREGDEALLYAEQLLHNCLVARGRPDRRSAVILWHAAQAFE